MIRLLKIYIVYPEQYIYLEHLEQRRCKKYLGAGLACFGHRPRRSNFMRYKDQHAVVKYGTRSDANIQKLKLQAKIPYFIPSIRYSPIT
jgi:hypothetical protein